jgi:hypothetical protein
LKGTTLGSTAAQLGRNSPIHAMRFWVPDSEPGALPSGNLT